MDTYTYFIVASEAEIAQMKSIDDVFSRIEQTRPLLGGYMSLEAITSLSKVFLHSEGKEPILIPYSWANTSRFYRIDTRLCKELATAEHERLIDASAPWSEEEPWRNTNVNRMDLAGFILEMAALCQQAVNSRSVYILISEEN
jgi:hypothetical protein